MVLSSNKEKWIHSNDTIINGNVTYQVKFIGVMEVGDSRGMDVVRDALQKLKFSRHIKRSEGSKPPKVDLHVNVNGMKISDACTKVVLHDIPLQRVSFCADDKQDKRLFSFIAKGDDGKHRCFGLDSQHQANNITLTIGQAFELAYDRFLTNDKATTSKQVIEMSQRIEMLEKENSALKERIVQLESPQRGNTPNQSALPTCEDDYGSLGTPSAKVTNQRKDGGVTSQSEIVSTPDLHIRSELPDLSIFNQSSASHSPSNQEYLRSKMSSLPDRKSGDRQQVSLDQTIASVQKAKISLKNLKDYVKQRKSSRDSSLSKSSPAQASYHTLPRAKTTPNPSLPPVTQSRSIAPTSHSSMSPNEAKKRNSAESLFIGIDEVMKTIECMMRDDTKKSESGSSSLTDHDTPRSAGKVTGSSSFDLSMISRIKETDISDSANVTPVDCGNYANIKHITERDVPPPLPPKPRNMITELIDAAASDSSCSASSSNMSSVDTATHSFQLWPADDNYMNPCENNYKLHLSNPARDNLTATLDRFSGEEGYMELKAVKAVAQSVDHPYIETTYDNVHKLMEAIRGKAVAPPKPSQAKKEIQQKSGPMNLPNHVMHLVGQDNIHSLQGLLPSEPPLSAPPLLSDPLTGEIGFMPVVSRGVTLSNSRHNHLFSDAMNEASRELSSVDQSHIVSQSNKTPPLPSKDIFDMQPFTPPTLIKLPSPSDVHPPKIPARGGIASTRTDDLTQQLFQAARTPNTSSLQLSSSKGQSDFIRVFGSSSRRPRVQRKEHAETQQSNTHHSHIVRAHVQDARQKDENFQRKLKVLEEGFSRGLGAKETEISLDAFDPLKTCK